MLKKNVVNGFRQLKGKNACFPLFDGFGIILEIIIYKL